MLIHYKTTIVENLCKKEKAAKKFFDNMKYFTDLQGVINLIDQAPTLSDLVAFPHLHFHPTDFYMKNTYGLDIGGRKSKYRLIIMPMDDEGNAVSRDEDFYSRCKQIRIVRIEEVSKHYE
jgi:proteic killer suppression protein